MKNNALFNNTAFNIGFWLGVVLCIVANYISYFFAAVEYGNNRFLPDNGINWGFPFNWFDFGNPLPIITNGLVYAFVCFGLGLLFRYVWSEIKNESK